MNPASLSCAVEFRYLTADGREYSVRGQVDQPRHLRKLLWLSFVLEVSSPAASQGLATKWFLTSWELGESLKAGSQPEDETLSVKWSRALRQYAVKQTILELDSGSVSDSDCMITSDKGELLVGCLPRTCDFRKQSNGDLICPLDSKGTPETTLAVCGTCAVPDPWERCAHVRHLKTHPIATDQAGLHRRECSGLCELGKDPGALIPYRCRAGPGAPICFEPQLIESPTSRQATGDIDVEDLLSALNVEWERVHRFRLFDLVSFGPLKRLRGDCTDGADYRLCPARSVRLGGPSRVS